MTTSQMPGSKGPVEQKVTWATVGTYVVGVVLLGLSDLLGAHPDIISGLPEWLNAILMPLVPAIGAFASGYVANHTPRPDLEPVPEPPSQNVVYRSTATGQPTQPDPIIKPGEAGPHGP